MTETIEDTRTIAEKQRASTVDYLRQLADYLEQNPDIPSPNPLTETDRMDIAWGGLDFWPKDPEQAARIVRSASGTWTKRIDADGTYMIFEQGIIAGRKTQVWVNREQVCTSKIVGKKTVTERVATYETVTKEVDDVAYECGSLMSAAMQHKLDRLAETAIDSTTI